MKARAPGKVVLSGAYAVLEGAPCLVASVDRYVTADSERSPEHIAEEVRAAMPPPYPHIDASELRSEGRKLGLGSSAAIVVASLATRAEFPCAQPEELQRLFEQALAAHRRAQGGGSGVDVASATFGGVLEFHYDPAGPGSVRRVKLPTVCLEVWSCAEAATTSGFLARVRAFATRAPDRYRAIIAELQDAAGRAVDACETSNADTWLKALRAQAFGLAELGAAAELPIFTRDVTEIAAVADAEAAVVLPAGAGGGDLALFCGHHPPTAELRAAAESRGLRRLDVRFGVRGVHRVDG